MAEGKMTEELQKLVEKKKHWGVLSGRDALVFMRHVESATDGTAGGWTKRDFEQLTRWQFGLRTTTQFQIVAGPAGAQAPEPVEVVLFRPLLRRKYTTFAERQTAQRAKAAARKARSRTPKNELTIHLVSGR
jgi:hypothetical protein